jgi:hypothetical protein
MKIFITNNVTEYIAKIDNYEIKKNVIKTFEDIEKIKDDKDLLLNKKIKKSVTKEQDVYTYYFSDKEMMILLVKKNQINEKIVMAIDVLQYDDFENIETNDSF